MEVSKKRHVSFLQFCYFIFGFGLFFCKHAYSYTDIAHDQITRSAFQYLNTTENIYPETKYWLKSLGQNQGFMEELLIRSVVDTDFRSNTWLDAWFHDAFTGGTNSVNFSMFTTLFHFINVAGPGYYWDYDGYSYLGSTQGGDDGYLATPSVTIRGDLTPPLGGEHPHPDANQDAFDVGLYKRGFKKSINAWNNMYFDGNEARSAVFPPSNIPAELAYEKMIASSRSPANVTTSWTEEFPVVDGIFSTKYYSRHYWRGEVEKLPSRFELLGVSLHMIQDLTIPHHSLGIIDACHAELEDKVDSESCSTTNNLRGQYMLGSFDGNIYPQCQSLYDPIYVKYYLDNLPFLNIKNNMTFKERYIQLALRSAKWKWGAFGDTGDFTTLSTILPHGPRYNAGSCKDLVKVQDVKDEIKRRYNLAVAASVGLFNLAAHQYEIANPINRTPKFYRALNLQKLLTLQIK